jgi:acyl carrier protein
MNSGELAVPQEQEKYETMRYIAYIRQILHNYGNLSIDVDSIEDSSDLYLAGLSSLATVNVMLALENHFDIEFPDAKLGRMTFSSVEAIAEVVAELKG